jgi:hypothetical protein
VSDDASQCIATYVLLGVRVTGEAQLRLLGVFSLVCTLGGSSGPRGWRCWNYKPVLYYYVHV